MILNNEGEVFFRYQAQTSLNSSGHFGFSSFFKIGWTISRIAWNWDPSVATDWTTTIKNPRRISGSSENNLANRYWRQPQYSSNYTTTRIWDHWSTNSSSQTWNQNIQAKKTYQKVKTKDTSNRQVIWIFWRVILSCILQKIILKLNLEF